MDFFCRCHLHNASKEIFLSKFFLNFMHWFKSAILKKLKNCQKALLNPLFTINLAPLCNLAPPEQSVTRKGNYFGAQRGQTGDGMV